MHGIGLRGFTRRHVKESRVKKAWLIDEAAIRGVTCISNLSIWIVVGINIEPVFRDLPRIVSV